jgi:hypothetical protein
MKRTKLTSLSQTAIVLSGLVALGAAQAQPTITGTYPDGTTLLQASDRLSFVVSAGVTNISVQLKVTSMTGATAFKVYTSAAGLTINGQNASAPLQTNNLYTATIVATDGNGVSATSTVSFDTLSPVHTWEAEDWDFDGGQFIDNPETNAYAGKIGVDGTDAHTATTSVGADYRPANFGNLGNEVCGDMARVQYKNSGLTDYDAGWNDAGNWGNYTRNYPAGAYNIFMRGAGWAAVTDSANLLQGGGPSGAMLGQFVVPNTATAANTYQNYTWVPLVDSSGTLIEWDTDGSQQTLTVVSVGAGYNANFYMLLPVPPPPGAPDAVIENLYPDGTYQFQSTNTLAFTITSTLGVNAADILVQLGETNLQGAGSSTLLTAGSGLTVSGPAESLEVTAPLDTNMLYGAFIQITDADGITMTTNLIFDTISPAYTWEAEDWDYEGGQFIDNPQINAYAGLMGVVNVDVFDPNDGGSAYRPSGVSGGLGNEVCGDKPRLPYLDAGLTDYDIGWTDGGSGLWGNFTRNYPAGKWNIFMRGAGWITTTESADLLQGGGPSGARLGRFAVPNTATAANTYQNYVWVPLIDIAGNLVEWDTDGSQQTLTIATVGGSWNANGFMLLPVNPSYKPVPFVSDVNPDSSKMFAPTNLFTFTANSVSGITADNVEVTLNGVKPVGLTFSGSSHTLHGACPVASNVVYTVVINLTDANGSSSYTTTFANVSADNYSFEGEDFDYENGQYFEDPQVGAYAGLSAVDLVDAHNTSGGNANYRPSTPGLGNEVCGDSPREQFTSAGMTDYNIGWTASGQWANYTRTYPAGVYNVLARGASPSGQNNGASLLWVTSGLGTDTQTTSPLGAFNFPLTGGWQTWVWLPLVDSRGYPVVVTTTGEVSTFRLNEDNGGFNINFFMLIPADTARPVISQLNPDGSALFQRTDKLSFVATSSSGIATNSVTVTLNGVVMPNLVFSGPATNLTVTCPGLQPDTAYTAAIFLSSIDNVASSYTYGFDTFSSDYYTFEAEDFDCNSGQFFDNPQANAYAGLPAVDGVDAHNTSGGATSYRPVDATTGDLGNEVNGDLPRPQYSTAGLSDYDIGWTAAGNWANFTRTYPAGVYYVIARGASPNGQNIGASLLWVTSGVGTSTQTTAPLGKFDFPLTGGWQTYTWTPLTDSQGNLVKVTTSGAASTLRLNQDNGGYNINFFLLVPAGPVLPVMKIDKTDSSHVTVSWTPAGGTLQASPDLGAAANWQAVGPANPAVLPSTGAARFFRVTNP